MKIHKRLRVATAIVAASLAVVVALLVVPAFASPGVTVNTFKNLNKQDAKDLHIQYNTVITALVQNPPNTFGSTTGVGRSNMIDLSNGTVAGNGGQLQLSATGQADPTKVVQWWWTDAHGNVLGHKHFHCTPPDCTSP